MVKAQLASRSTVLLRLFFKDENLRADDPPVSSSICSLVFIGEVVVKPILGEGEFRLLESMAGVAPFEGDAGAGMFEEDGETLGVVQRDHGVVSTSEQEDGRAIELRRIRRLEGKHGTEKDGAGEDVGPEEKHRSSDVGAVGVTDGDHLTEVVAGALVFDKVGQFVGAADEIVLVENTGGEAAEEAGLSVFEDLSARTEQGRAGTEEATEREEIVLVAAGAVEQKKRGRCAGFEAGDHQNFFSHSRSGAETAHRQTGEDEWRNF